MGIFLEKIFKDSCDGSGLKVSVDPMAPFSMAPPPLKIALVVGIKSMAPLWHPVL